MRMRISNSSNVMRPRLDMKFVRRCQLDAIELVKAFLKGGRLQLFVGAKERGVWHALAAGARLVAAHGIDGVGREIVADDPKTDGFGGFNVLGALGDQQVGIVHHQGLLCS